MTQPEHQLANPPIFVAGPLRSGSTLVRLLLQHHSQLNIFGEFEGAVSQAKGNDWPSIESYRNFVKHDRQTKALNLTINTSLDYESLVHSFMHQLEKRSTKPFVGASVHSRMDLLPKLWPDARFIHILRDPRDVARSAIGMGWVSNVYEGTSYWVDPEMHWDKLCAVVPEEHRTEVRYEELVADPQTHLSNICTFLGLEYESAMLDIAADTTYSAPDPAYSYQWKSKLSVKEINWVEHQCADLLVKRGYELSGNPITKPSLPQVIYIKAHNRINRSTGNIKRWGLSLWVQHLVAKNMGFRKWHRRVQAQIDDIAIEHLK